jgi:hypothetical protein
MYNHLTTTLGIPVFFSDQHAEDAALLASTIDETAWIVNSRWSLPTPKSCRAYILTDWSDFIKHSVPKLLYFFVGATKPLWKRRIQRTFKIAGGWMMPWPGRPAVGVKPISEIERCKTTLGERIFLPVDCSIEKFRHIACHEFVHAFTAHLKLPPWINEGLAMCAVDLLAGQGTVRPETRSADMQNPSLLSMSGYHRVSEDDYSDLLSIYTTGYWATKRLDEVYHDKLVAFLAKRRSRSEAYGLASIAFQG